MWGTATADHQVEGNSVDDWTAWEFANSERLVQNVDEVMEIEAVLGANPPDWENIRVQATNPENYISGLGANHYDRYREDFDMMERWGLNAYRFSISWARIEPQEGYFDESVISHYASMIYALRQRGIEPFVTLNHYTLPQWVANKGGWLNRNIVEWFRRYADHVATTFGDEVKHWITLNEPVPQMVNAYVTGLWPPSKRRHYFSFYRALRMMIKAHKEAYYTIKVASPSSLVSIVENVALVQVPEDAGLRWRWQARFYEYVLNEYFLNSVKDKFDFLAVNHYFRFKFDKRGMRHNFDKMSDMGWELYPAGLGLVASKMYKKYQKPVFITEHGLADEEDSRREWFIRESLRGLHQAIQTGVDVRGYFHWSFIDNFEWDKGWWPKFGLVAFDKETGERFPRPSSKDYSKIAKANGLTLE